MAELTTSVPKKPRKGKVYIPRAPKPRTSQQLLADQQAAHAETCSKLDAALALLRTKEQDCSNSKAVVQSLQQQMSDLSAELQQKQTDLRLMSSQLAEAHGAAAALDATVKDMSAKLVAQERVLQQQQRAAAQNLAARKKQAAVTAEEVSRAQLAHVTTLAKLTQCKTTANACIATLKQQLQEKDASLLEVEACNRAALHDLAAQQFAAQEATRQIAALQEQLAVSQDSLAQLQDKHKAAQDDLAFQKAATAAAELRITDLKLNSENLTASLSEAQRRYELVSADLEAQKAAARTAESSLGSLHVQLQDSSSRCAELQAAHDDVAWQASAAAAASCNRVQELQGELQDALAKLQQLQLAKEESVSILTDIAADSLVSQAACEFAMGQRLKAADTAAKAQRDKLAIKDAEVRAGKWQLAKSEASIKRMQREVAQLHQQLAVVAEAAVQLNVKVQTVVWGQAAATMRTDEADTATQAVRHQLSIAQQKLADAEDQLLGWACAAAATSLLPTDPASSSTGPADDVCSSSAPTVLHSSLPSPTNDEMSQHNSIGPIELSPKPVILLPFTNYSHPQIPTSPDKGVPVSGALVAHDEVPCIDSLKTLKQASHSTTSKRATQVPNLYKPLNKVFKRFGALCSGGFSKRSTSPQAMGDDHHDTVFSSSPGVQHTGIVPSPGMSLHGTADLGGERTFAAAQERHCTASTAAAVEAAAGATGRGITCSTAIAAVRRLSRWGSAAAGVGDAGCNSPATDDTAATYNTTGSQSGAEGSVAEREGDIAATDVYDDVATDGETAVVTVIEWSAGKKAGPLAAPARSDVEAVASV